MVKRRRTPIFLELLSLAILLSVIFVSSGVPFALGQATTYGTPIHSHDGWPIQKTSSYTSSYTKHIQGELNFLADNNVFDYDYYQAGDCPADGGGATSLLCIDGAFGTRTANWVKAFQKDFGLTIDGIVGNQTWTAMESAVLLYGGVVRYVSRFTENGVSLRILIYGQCIGRTLTSASAGDVLVPWKTQAEFNSFRDNAANNIAALSTFSPNCDVSGSSGSSGASSPPSSCSFICEDYCSSYGCTSCSGCYSSQSCNCVL